MARLSEALKFALGWTVAIGWGKSYEDQVEEGNQRLSQSDRPRRLSNAERVRSQQIESLKLSRARVLEQLERSRHEAHRQSLLKGLQAIEQEIEELNRQKD